jgi:hypothetical protein
VPAMDVLSVLQLSLLSIIQSTLEIDWSIQKAIPATNSVCRHTLLD